MDQATIRETTDSVIVAAKVRSLQDFEHKMECKKLLRTHQEPNHSGEIIVCNSERFNFDYVFDTDTLDNIVYNQMLADLVNLAFKGHHVAIVAYGMKDSGKSSILGLEESTKASTKDTGLILHTIDHIFAYQAQHTKEYPNETQPIFFGYSKMTNDKIIDLLSSTESTTRHPLELESMKKIQIRSPHSTKKRIKNICRNRDSNWSHENPTKVIEFALAWPSTDSTDFTSSVIMSRIIFIELAAPNRVDLNENYETEELFQLLKAVHDDTPDREQLDHTRLMAYLQNNLCGDSTTVLLTCISPVDVTIDQTFKVLKTVSRIKSSHSGGRNDCKGNGCGRDSQMNPSLKSKTVRRSLNGVFHGLLLASKYDPDQYLLWDQKIKRRYFQHGTRASLSIELLNSVRRNVWEFGPQTLNQVKREMWVYDCILNGSLSEDEEELVPQLIQIKADLLKKRIKFKDYKDQLMTNVVQEKERLAALRKVIEIFETDDTPEDKDCGGIPRNTAVVYELAKKMLKIIDNARNQQELKRMKMNELKAKIQSPGSLIDLYKRLAYSDKDYTSIDTCAARVTGVTPTIKHRRSLDPRRHSSPATIKPDHDTLLEVLKHKIQYAFATRQWFCDTLYLLTIDQSANRLENEQRHLTLTILDAKVTVKELVEARLKLHRCVGELKRKKVTVNQQSGVVELKQHIGYLTELISNFQELILIGSNLSCAMRDANQ